MIAWTDLLVIPSVVGLSAPLLDYLLDMPCTLGALYFTFHAAALSSISIDSLKLPENLPSCLPKITLSAQSIPLSPYSVLLWLFLLKV